MISYRQSDLFKRLKKMLKDELYVDFFFSEPREGKVFFRAKNIVMKTDGEEMIKVFNQTLSSTFNKLDMIKKENYWTSKIEEEEIPKKVEFIEKRNQKLNEIGEYKGIPMSSEFKVIIPEKHYRWIVKVNREKPKKDLEGETK